MSWLCLDCRLVTDELADGRYCPRCRSGVLRDATSEPRTSGVTRQEGTDLSDAP